jgi:hypothetical protein
MANLCYSSIQACLLRWANVTAAGVPQPGADDGYRTNSLIQLGVSTELEAGVDTTLKNGCGDICAAFKEQDKIKRVGLSTSLCKLDSELIQLMVGGETFVSAGTTMGYQLPTVDDAATNGGVLEVWTKAYDGDAQATIGADAAYWHFVFPRTRWSPGDFSTASDAFLEFPLTGFGDPNPSVSANGPYNDWPTFIANAGGITSAMGWYLDDEIPASACGYVTVPSGS